MAKFKHGFPVPSAVMVGFLSLHNKADRLELIKLATAMVLSEELKQDIDRMGQWVNADLELARSFQLPKEVDAPRVWAWRLEGLQIIGDAAKWNIEMIKTQAQQDKGVKWRATLGFQATSIIEAFKSKIKKEQKLADEVIRKGLFT